MGFMRDIMEDRAAILEADAWFDNVPILTTRLGDLDFLVDSATNKLGTSVVLWSPTFSVENQQIVDPFGEMQFTASVFEQVQVNQAAEGTQKFAEDTAEAIVGLWMRHKKLTDSENSVYPLAQTITPVPDPDFVRYDVKFGVKAGYKREDEPSLLGGNSQQILTGAGIPILTGELVNP